MKRRAKILGLVRATKGLSRMFPMNKTTGIMLMMITKNQTTTKKSSTMLTNIKHS